jgi:uncharacterized protein YdeI (YjbR/CyaY-like superfamily)
LADRVIFASSEAFDVWLVRHGSNASEIWLRLAKKAASEQTLNYAQALEVALCHGWIDGVKKPDSDEHFLQRFTPRKASSPWSKINREKAEALIAQGRVREGGLDAVAQAKANGTWDKAYAGSATIGIPEDFAAALKCNKAADAFFNKLDRQNRYAVLYRIGVVKKAETRARKIAQFVEMLAKGEKLHP